MNAQEGSEAGPPPYAISIEWVEAGGNPAMLFPPRIWSMISALADKQGAPSPQALITRCVSELINGNAKKTPEGPVKIKIEWVTYGDDANQSPEALLVFHRPTLTTISELWRMPEAKITDLIACLVLKSLEPALGPSGTA